MFYTEEHINLNKYGMFQLLYKLEDVKKILSGLKILEYVIIMTSEVVQRMPTRSSDSVAIILLT